MARRVLLDENVPQKLRLLLTSHEVFTTAYKGWAGISNGRLLDAAEKAGFEVMVTADQGINYQQNLIGRKLAILVLSTNQNNAVIAHAAHIDVLIDTIQPGYFMFFDLGA